MLGRGPSPHVFFFSGRIQNNANKVEVRMKLLRVLAPISVVLAVGALASSAHAQAGAQPVHVVQTQCDTLSLNPPLVRVTFGVINLGPIPVCSVHLIPIQSGSTPPDSCRILDCSSPPGWQCQRTPDGGAVWWPDPTQPPGCIQEGQ